MTGSEPESSSLNQYLHRFGIEKSPECACNNDCIESVKHYLLHCPDYDCERDKIRKRMGIRGLWIEKLLALQDLKCVENV